MTKREINETISAVNAVLAVARDNVRENDWSQALVQLDGANQLTLLAKVRVEQYIEEKA